MSNPPVTKSNTAQGVSIDGRPYAVAWAEYYYAHRAASGIVYTPNARPIPNANGKQPPIMTDCSGFTTYCYQLGGLPDPNGCNYNGAGNTTYQLRNNKVINISQVEPGDLVLWGEPTHHVAIVVQVSGTKPITMNKVIVVSNDGVGLPLSRQTVAGFTNWASFQGEPIRFVRCNYLVNSKPRPTPPHH